MLTGYHAIHHSASIVTRLSVELILSFVLTFVLFMIDTAGKYSSLVQTRLLLALAILVAQIGVNQALYYYNRPNSFLIKYCQHICAIVLNRKEGRPSSLLLPRILRCEIGYNFLEARVAAERIPERVKFQVAVA
jgi:hypothetical protein